MKGKKQELPHSGAAAKYDPNRLSNGHFVKGNTAGQGWHYLRRLNELRALWWDCISTDDMRLITDELKHLCLNAKHEDVKLKAMIYFLDRTLGKPESQVNVDVSHSQMIAPGSINLTPEQVKVLETIVSITAIDPTPNVAKGEAAMLGEPADAIS